MPAVTPTPPPGQANLTLTSGLHKVEGAMRVSPSPVGPPSTVTPSRQAGPNYKWAGIYMVPLTVGFLIAGPVSGILSDRYGSRPFATAGLLVSGASFLSLNTLPIDFSYPWFALLILMWALGAGIFFSP